MIRNTYLWCSRRGRGGRHMFWALWAHLEQFIICLVMRVLGHVLLILMSKDRHPP